jgi:hypothetical protein
VNKNPLFLSFFFHEPFPKRTTLLLVPLSLKIPFLRQQLKNSTIGTLVPSGTRVPPVFFTKQGTSHHTQHFLEGTKGTTGRYHRYFLQHFLSQPSLYTVQPALWACCSLLAERFVEPAWKERPCTRWQVPASIAEYSTHQASVHRHVYGH